MTDHAEKPVPPPRLRACRCTATLNPQARLHQMLHDRGWLADLHILVRTQTFGEPDWSEVDSDWTYETAVPCHEQKSVQPTLISVDEDAGDTVVVTFPGPAVIVQPCPDHQPGVLRFPLTHQGLDILEAALPTIEAVRLGAEDLAACLADGPCGRIARAAEAKAKANAH
ncbi:hypothetical protein [Streptomyces sp. NPDC088915]|uniref:hypothetical protein n=1 Tax=Streptomyces sp. NPDC088915 TaxID=3365912 RepID=UPI003800DF12